MMEEQLIQTKRVLFRGNTINKKKRSIKQYNKAILRYQKIEQEKKDYQLKQKLKRYKNLKSFANKTSRALKRLPSTQYSESGRLALLSNLRKNMPVEQGNILNARNVYLSKTDKRVNYKIL